MFLAYIPECPGLWKTLALASPTVKGSHSSSIVFPLGRFRLSSIAYSMLCLIGSLGDKIDESGCILACGVSTLLLVVLLLLDDEKLAKTLSSDNDEFFEFSELSIDSEGVLSFDESPVKIVSDSSENNNPSEWQWNDRKKHIYRSSSSMWGHVCDTLSTLEPRADKLSSENAIFPLSVWNY